MLIHVEAKVKEDQEILKAVVPVVLDGFTRLEKLYPEIVLPDKLILKCFRKQYKPVKTLICALCGHKPHKGEWYIKVRRTINGNFSKQHTILHEIAHIGEALLTGKWGHGKTFEKIFQQLKDCQGYFESTDIVSSFIVLIALLILIVKVFTHFF
jgi:hypothetical protein